MRGPIIQGISPKLAGCAEIVRRNAGHHAGLTIRTQKKQSRIRPDIGAVVRDKNGNIANQLDVALPAISSQTLPLVFEQKLNDFRAPNFFCEFFASGGESIRLTLSQLQPPLRPGHATMRILERGEKRVIIQPFHLRRAKGVELLL